VVQTILRGPAACIGSQIQHVRNNLLTLIGIKLSTAIECSDAPEWRPVIRAFPIEKGSVTSNEELWSRNEELTVACQPLFSLR
jgi:hypothetical protein